MGNYRSPWATSFCFCAKLALHFSKCADEREFSCLKCQGAGLYDDFDLLGAVPLQRNDRVAVQTMASHGLARSHCALNGFDTPGDASLSRISIPARTLPLSGNPLASFDA